MLLGEVRGGFPWGVLLITDKASTNPIPNWASDEDQVTSTADALVVRVVHQDEGEADVHVWSGRGDLGGAIIYRGTLATPSGTVRVGDALGEHAEMMPLGAGVHRIDVYADSAREASVVHIVFDSVSS
jgi:hypothetical protein